jgi:hypothetical protein
VCNSLLALVAVMLFQKREEAYLSLYLTKVQSNNNKQSISEKENLKVCISPNNLNNTENL